MRQAEKHFHLLGESKGFQFKEREQVRIFCTHGLKLAYAISRIINSAVALLKKVWFFIYPVRKRNCNVHRLLFHPSFFQLTLALVKAPETCDVTIYLNIKYRYILSKKKSRFWPSHRRPKDRYANHHREALGSDYRGLSSTYVHVRNTNPRDSKGQEENCNIMELNNFVLTW